VLSLARRFAHLENKISALTLAAGMNVLSHNSTAQSARICLKSICFLRVEKTIQRSLLYQTEEKDAVAQALII